MEVQGDEEAQEGKYRDEMAGSQLPAPAAGEGCPDPVALDPEATGLPGAAGAEVGWPVTRAGDDSSPKALEEVAVAPGDGARAQRGGHGAESRALGGAWEPEEERSMLKRGTVVEERFLVEKKIGEGTFSEIFRARDACTGLAVALKVEKAESVLKWETTALQKLQSCPLVCRFIHAGVHHGRAYIAMELLGQSLSDLRKKQPKGHFSASGTAVMGEMMLRAIRGVHEHGLLHRDVKPSNFAMGLGPKGAQCFIIDFGIAKKYRTSAGALIPQRDSAEFRGSSAYASVHSHLQKDLGRRDDLWSLFYVLVEFFQGELPWRGLQERVKVKEAKLHYNCHPHEMLGRTGDKQPLPDELLTFAEYLRSLDFEDAPDYDFLEELLASWHAREYKLGERFPWEYGESTVPAGPGSLHQQRSSKELLTRHEHEHSKRRRREHKRRHAHASITAEAPQRDQPDEDTINGLHANDPTVVQSIIDSGGAGALAEESHPPHPSHSLFSPDGTPSSSPSLEMHRAEESLRRGPPAAEPLLATRRPAPFPKDGVTSPAAADAAGTATPTLSRHDSQPRLSTFPRSAELALPQEREPVNAEAGPRPQLSGPGHRGDRALPAEHMASGGKRVPMQGRHALAKVGAQTLASAPRNQRGRPLERSIDADTGVPVADWREGLAFDDGWGLAGTKSRQAPQPGSPHWEADGGSDQESLRSGSELDDSTPRTPGHSRGARTELHQGRPQGAPGEPMHTLHNRRNRLDALQVLAQPDAERAKSSAHAGSLEDVAGKRNVTSRGEGRLLERSRRVQGRALGRSLESRSSEREHGSEMGQGQDEGERESVRGRQEHSGTEVPSNKGRDIMEVSKARQRRQQALRPKSPASGYLLSEARHSRNHGAERGRSRETEREGEGDWERQRERAAATRGSQPWRGDGSQQDSGWRRPVADEDVSRSKNTRDGGGVSERDAERHLAHAGPGLQKQAQSQVGAERGSAPSAAAKDKEWRTGSRAGEREAAVLPLEPEERPWKWVCVTELRTGRCPKGPGCKHGHSKSTHPERAKSLCFDFLVGGCHKGDDCPKFHWSRAEEAAYIKLGRLPAGAKLLRRVDDVSKDRARDGLAGAGSKDARKEGIRMDGDVEAPGRTAQDPDSIRARPWATPSRSRGTERSRTTQDASLHSQAHRHDRIWPVLDGEKRISGQGLGTSNEEDRYVEHAATGAGAECPPRLPAGSPSPARHGSCSLSLSEAPSLGDASQHEEDEWASPGGMQRPRWNAGLLEGAQEARKGQMTRQGSGPAQGSALRGSGMESREGRGGGPGLGTGDSKRQRESGQSELEMQGRGSLWQGRCGSPLKASDALSVELTSSSSLSSSSILSSSSDQDDSASTTSLAQSALQQESNPGSKGGRGLSRRSLEETPADMELQDGTRIENERFPVEVDSAHTRAASSVAHSGPSPRQHPSLAHAGTPALSAMGPSGIQSRFPSGSPREGQGSDAWSGSSKVPRGASNSPSRLRPGVGQEPSQVQRLQHSDQLAGSPRAPLRPGTGAAGRHTKDVGDTEELPGAQKPHGSWTRRDEANQEYAAPARLTAAMLQRTAWGASLHVTAKASASRAQHSRHSRHEGQRDPSSSKTKQGNRHEGHESKWERSKAVGIHVAGGPSSLKPPMQLGPKKVHPVHPQQLDAAQQSKVNPKVTGASRVHASRQVRRQHDQHANQRLAGHVPAAPLAVGLRGKRPLDRTSGRIGGEAPLDQGKQRRSNQHKMQRVLLSQAYVEHGSRAAALPKAELDSPKMLGFEAHAPSEGALGVCPWQICWVCRVGAALPGGVPLGAVPVCVGNSTVLPDSTAVNHSSAAWHYICDCTGCSVAHTLNDQSTSPTRARAPSSVLQLCCLCQACPAKLQVGQALAGGSAEAAAGFEVPGAIWSQNNVQEARSCLWSRPVPVHGQAHHQGDAAGLPADMAQLGDMMAVPVETYLPLPDPCLPWEVSCSALDPGLEYGPKDPEMGTRAAGPACMHRLGLVEALTLHSGFVALAGMVGATGDSCVVPVLTPTNDSGTERALDRTCGSVGEVVQDVPQPFTSRASRRLSKGTPNGVRTELLQDAGMRSGTQVEYRGHDGKLMRGPAGTTLKAGMSGVAAGTGISTDDGLPHTSLQGLGELGVLQFAAKGKRSRSMRGAGRPISRQESATFLPSASALGTPHALPEAAAWLSHDSLEGGGQESTREGASLSPVACSPPHSQPGLPSLSSRSPHGAGSGLATKGIAGDHSKERRGFGTAKAGRPRGRSRGGGKGKGRVVEASAASIQTTPLIESDGTDRTAADHDVATFENDPSFAAELPLPHPKRQRTVRDSRRTPVERLLALGILQPSSNLNEDEDLGANSGAHAAHDMAGSAADPQLAHALPEPRMQEAPARQWKLAMAAGSERDWETTLQNGVAHHVAIGKRSGASFRKRAPGRGGTEQGLGKRHSSQRGQTERVRHGDKGRQGGDDSAGSLDTVGSSGPSESDSISSLFKEESGDEAGVNATGPFKE